MHNNLNGVKIAILACDGFEESEMVMPRKALKDQGAIVELISPESDSVKSWLDGKWSKAYKVDVKLDDAKPGDYDAILLPGGVLNPDKLRTFKKAIRFINHFFDKNKLIAAICHASLTLVETKKLRNRKMTSYHSIKSDMLNAGASWVNKQVVIDGSLITSREPKDIPAFNKAIIKFLSK